MSGFLNLLIWNVTLATGLAIAIALAGFLPALQRRPALRHWLWLLVLVKLATPPLIPLPILSSTDEASEATPVDAAEVGAVAKAMPLPTPIDSVLPVPTPVDYLPPQNAVDPPVATAAQVPAAVAGSSRVDWLLALLTVSLLITGLLLTRSIGQMIRLFRLFVRCNRQDRRTSDIAAREATKMHCRRELTVALVSTRMTPLLWVRRGRPTIVLPAALLEQLDDEQLACIIRHELAHFVRRDHYANAIAFIVASFFWWNPIAWWARRELRRAQEACCDALVVASVPQSRRCYAETLLHVIDFLGGQNAPLPHLVAGFGDACSLKRRFEMIANERVTHRLSRVAAVLLVCVAMAIGCYPVLSQTGTDARSFRLAWQPEGSRYRLLELPASDNGKQPKNDVIVTCARMRVENNALVLIDAVVESEGERLTAAELTVPIVDVTNGNVGERVFEAARRANSPAMRQSVEAPDEQSKQPRADKTQRVYALQFADARQVHEILSVIKQPETVVEVHARTNQVVVRATEAQHREVEAVIKQLDSKEPPRLLTVIELTKSDPKAVQILVKKMFEGTNEDVPKMDVDLDRRRLIVRGTPAQVRQVRDLIVGLELLTLAPATQKESDRAASDLKAQTSASDNVDVPPQPTTLTQLEELKWQPQYTKDKWDADRALWLRQLMMDLKAIKTGATRGQVDEMLVSDGPTRSSKAHRYQHPKCPFIKLDVFFDVETGFAPASPDDTVTRVEGPIVDLSSNWGRW